MNQRLPSFHHLHDFAQCQNGWRLQQYRYIGEAIYIDCRLTKANYDFDQRHTVPEKKWRVMEKMAAAMQVDITNLNRITPHRRTPRNTRG